MTTAKPMNVVRFSASKVAVVVGLHEFGDPTEEFVECIYQDREELLASDAKQLNLTIVTKDNELDAVVRKTGRKLAPQLQEVLAWARDRNAPAARVADAHKLLGQVKSLLATAQQQKKLTASEAAEAQSLLAEKIRQSVGVRNENLALKSYERHTGSIVRLTNEHYYFLTFPHPSAFASELQDHQIQRTVITKRPWSPDQDGDNGEDADQQDEDESTAPLGYFSICGMVDGVADALRITEEDEWEMDSLVVEVKNRMRAFRDPPPLHDHVQMAVYMKMLQVTQGHLVQCLNEDQTTILVSPIAMNSPPLSLTTARGTAQEKTTDMWSTVILPRLYQVAAAIHKMRENDLLRLAYLNGSPHERLEMLRRECEFL